MRFAGTIFIIAGLAFLAWDLALTFSSGIRLGTWLMALVGAGLLYQGYGLFRGAPRAPGSTLIVATVIAIGSAGVACILITPILGNTVGVPGEYWLTVLAVLSVGAAFGAASIALWRQRRVVP